LKKRIEEIEVKISRLNDRLNNIRKEIEGLTDGECNICMSKYEGPSMLPCCNNIVCGNCLITWVESSRSTKCPLCRKSLEIETFTNLDIKLYIENFI